MAGRGGVWGGVVAVVVLVSLFPAVFGEIKYLSIKDDMRAIIPFETFGFLPSGEVSVVVSNVNVKEAGADRSRMGFFLSTMEDLVPVLSNLEAQGKNCLMDSKLMHTLFTLAETEKFNYTHTVQTSNEYSLFFENCVKTEISMDVMTSMYNVEGGYKDFLAVGQTQLPRMYFVFFLANVALLGVWIYVCWAQKASVHRIHALMGLLVVLKALNMICEAEDKQYVKRTGTPHGWDVAYYIFNSLRGLLLFSVIVLIGTGWSFLKPFLQDKEKKVLMVVIPLQVFANTAYIVYDEAGPSTKDFFTWKQVFLLLDIICCCAVLFPIVWSIKHLREASRTDGKAARNLVKLTLFRQFYIVVVSYIYFTRIVVFALYTVTVYRYRWTSKFAEEAANLAFYIYTGYKFRPVSHNPYFVLDDDEEEAAALEALKDDEFDL
ncbi:hypothetical protein KC19_2G127400 [Ceratodon purpureus]|uniref:Protein GPR107 n=1 Tax=Ceratodon purpureus TaxID=3225 RepID=A0A8T0IVD3_CERPU|nr:hypothetical protein KC19_2G127400 [Ceratodon purpureus]